MKKFITKTLYFMLPILALAILLEILLRMIPNNYKVKKDYLDHHASEIETLILGSSHSFYGLNPKYFTSNTFNAAQNGQLLDNDAEIVNKYKTELKNLKTIVLPISYFSLFSDWEVVPEPWRIKNYMIYYDLKPFYSIKYHSEVLTHRLDFNLKRLSSYYRHGKSDVSSSPKGWYQRDIPKVYDIAKSGIAAAQRHTVPESLTSSKFQQIVQENERHIQSILDWAQKEDITVILLITPTYESYYQTIDSGQLQQTHDIMEAFASKYNHCIYLGLLKDDRFTLEDFEDGDHLSPMGAKKLSVIIDDTIVNIQR